MLTPKQHKLLLFIHKNLQENGVSPSYEEMCEAIGVRSKSGIHRMVVSLQERQFLRRLPYRARALEILRLPQNVSSDQEGYAVAPDAANDNTVYISMHGRIAAGTPIEAISDPSFVVGVPANIVGGRNCYALEVEGDSMVDLGILDGDTIIVERSEDAESGSIVVALIDDQEATLKRLVRREGKIALEAANPAYSPQVYHPDRVKIQGCLAGLLRHY